MPARTGEKYVAEENCYFFLSRKLQGSNITDIKDRAMARKMGCAMARLLAEETEEAFTKKEWLESVEAVVAGYESVLPLSAEEKNAIACVMECIELLFVAYYLGIEDRKHAGDAYGVFRFIQNCEEYI